MGEERDWTPILAHIAWLLFTIGGAGFTAALAYFCLLVSPLAVVPGIVFGLGTTYVLGQVFRERFIVILKGWMS